MKPTNNNKKLYVVIMLTVVLYMITCIVTYDTIDKFPALALSEEANQIDQEEKNIAASKPLNSKEVLDNIIKLDRITHELSMLSTLDTPDIAARNAIIMDVATGRSLYKKNAFEQVAMASTTKIMTFIIVAEYCDIKDITTVSKESAATGGSTMHLKKGEEISVEALLYGLLLNSGNDAACALAEHTAGSITEFCKLMNEKARLLGAYDTHFTSPHGLDNNEHYTTCYDLALITKAAIQDPLFVKIISTKQITISGHSLTNTNPLLGEYEEVVGGKTGYTSKANRCLMLYVKNNNISAIIILLGSPSSAARISDGAYLTKYATKCFKTFTIECKGKILETIKVSKGTMSSVYNIITDNITLTLAKKDILKIEYITSHKFDMQQTAPVFSNDIMSTIYISSSDDLLCVVNCKPSSNVPRKTYTDHLSDIIRAFPNVFT